MTKAKIQSRDDVLALLNYDAATGVFTWRDPLCARKAKGGIAGFVEKTGYRRIRLWGVSYPAHRLAWLVVHGRWPTKMIDHINGDPADNRIANLREASNAQNQQNKKPSRRSATGLKGVTRIARRGGVEYRAGIYNGGRYTVLGHFRCPHAAHAAYAKAAAEQFGEFARVR